MTRSSNLARLLLVLLLASVMEVAVIETSSGGVVDHSTSVRATAKTPPSRASEEWKQIELSERGVVGFRWCESARTMLVTGGNTSGIRLLDVATGATQVLTTRGGQYSLGCSRDGRYVFITEEDAYGAEKLSAYDLVTREQAKLYSFTFEFFRGGAGLHNGPLSPTNAYLVAPFGVENELRLPGGHTVRRLAVGSGVNFPPELQSRFSDFVWSADGRTIVLLEEDSRSALIYEVLSQTARTVKLIDGYVAIKLRLAPDLKQLYFLATDDEQTMLYVKDLTRPETPSQIVVSGADDFELFPSGELLYSKPQYATRVKGTLQLRIRRLTGKDELIWSVPFQISKKSSFGPLSPDIASDGNAITFSYQDPEGSILHIVLVRTQHAPTSLPANKN